MGRQWIEGFLEMGVENDVALQHHLQHNHYPPVPLSMIEPCKQAIDLANEGKWEILVPMPKGISYKGRNVAPVHAIIDNHHLEFFLMNEEPYIEFEQI